MDLKSLINNSKLDINEKNILFNEPMSKYTTFKIGGPAECLIKIKKIEDLLQIINFTKINNINLTIIGNGSNVLISDKGIKGIVVLNRLEEISFKRSEQNVEIDVGAGTKINSLAMKLLKEEITGFEELSGIPGTIGGAIIMNAGAHGKEIKDIVKSVKCVDNNGNVYNFENSELGFKYRSSNLKNKNYIITEARLILHNGDYEEIKSKMEQYKQYRKEKQPIEYPSAGSTFKRGEDYITAKLIEDAGLKGYKIGGAEVSIKHSGFVVNKGEATAKDVLELVQHIKDKIKLEFNKDIELEIEFIGEK